MRIDVEKLQSWEEQEKQISKLEKGYKKASANDKRVMKTSKAVYRIELPVLPSDAETKKQMKRVARTLKYQCEKDEYKRTAGIVAYSEHASWTPFTLKTGAKGGRPFKDFSKQEKYRRKGHNHNVIIGENAHKLATRIFENEKRYLAKKFPKMKFRSTKSAVRSCHHIAKNYICWQAENNYCFETKNFDDVAEGLQENDVFDPLDF